MEVHTYRVTPHSYINTDVIGGTYRTHIQNEKIFHNEYLSNFSLHLTGYVSLG